MQNFLIMIGPINYMMLFIKLQQIISSSVRTTFELSVQDKTENKFFLQTPACIICGISSLPCLSCFLNLSSGPFLALPLISLTYGHGFSGPRPLVFRGDSLHLIHRMESRSTPFTPLQFFKKLPKKYLNLC